MGRSLLAAFLGVFAWGMKHFKWPRPPPVLGFILGEVLERYMFISIQRYRASWMLRPVVVVMFVMAGLSLMRPFIQDIKAHGGIKGMLSDFHAPKFGLMHIFPVFMLALFGVMMAEALTWNLYAKLIPTIVGSGAILFCTLSLINDVFKSDTHKARGAGKAALPTIEFAHFSPLTQLSALEPRSGLIKLQAAL